jgi:hypothetical protein
LARGEFLYGVTLFQQPLPSSRGVRVRERVRVRVRVRARVRVRVKVFQEPVVCLRLHQEPIHHQEGEGEG